MPTRKRTRRTYSDEFKREAIALVTEQGYSKTDAGRSLDIPANMIGRWIRELKEQTHGTALSADERDELKKLRRENRELRMETDILKKASAYFAKQMK
jgi:transposase